MASALYPKFKQSLLTAGIDIENSTIKAALVDTGTYTYSTTHQYYSDLSGVVGTAVELSSKTITGGVFDAADTTFTSVSGNSVEAVVVYEDTGTTTTSQLVCFIDGFSAVTPNSGNIVVAWHSSGIFSL